MTVKYSKLYISKYRIFLFRYTRRKKNRDSFLRLRSFEALIFTCAASSQSFPALWQSEHH